MADVLAVSILLLFLGSAYPGMLFLWWLLFPNHVVRARQRIQRSLWGSLLVGFVVSLVSGLPAVILLSLPSGLTKFFGWVVAAFLLIWSSLGAAGLVAHLAKELQVRSLDQLSPVRAFLRAALVLEFSSIFPVIGWFVIFPFAAWASLGASFLGFFAGDPTSNTSNAPEARGVLDTSPVGPGL